jgi:predicted ATPase
MAPVPDPSLVQSVGEFVSYLRLLKVWAGDPSFVELQRRCGVPSSTLADAANPGRPQLPRLETVRAFVLACGAHIDLVRWELAWRIVQSRHLPGCAPAPPSRPRQLPRPAEHFVGRRDVLDELDRPPDARPWAPLVAIVGGAGVGKSALALRWAHQQADSYPDGQLYVDLQDAGHQPVNAICQALLLLLGALGVPAYEVPAGLAARVGLYRSLTRARRLLVMLDGAPDAGQVRALLPAGPACLTVVTSRNRLSGLVARDGARRLALPPLPPASAEQLIGLLVGPERTAREPAAARQLCRLCDYLPLALRIAAARIADAPQWPIAAYVNRLATNPMAALEVPGDGSMSMRAALDRSGLWLSRPASCLLHRLALAPTVEFTTCDAADLVGTSVSEASWLVDLLMARHLVEPAGPDRYRLPELVRRYAAAAN